MNGLLTRSKLRADAKVISLLPETQSVSIRIEESHPPIPLR